MTKKEIVNHNISLTFEFIWYLLKNQEKIKNLPDKFEVEFLDNEFVIPENKVKKRFNKFRYYKVDKSFQPVKNIAAHL